MPHSCPMWSPTWRNSAHTSDSGSCDPTLLVSVVGVTDRVRLSLGYEPNDEHLHRLGSSLYVESAWTDGQAEVAPARSVSAVPPYLTPSRSQIRLRMQCSTCSCYLSDDRESQRAAVNAAW